MRLSDHPLKPHLKGGEEAMNSTHLFSIEWDDSYNDPDYSIPGTFQDYLNRMSEVDVERLAKNLEFLARGLRNRTAPFERRLT